MIILMIDEQRINPPYTTQKANLISIALDPTPNRTESV